MAHTPGPWELVGEWTEQRPLGTERYVAGGTVMAHKRTHYIAAFPWVKPVTPGGIAEAEANHRLIAAAPDLYEAAQQIADECADVNMPSNGAMEKLLAAIAKAEGR